MKKALLILSMVMIGSLVSVGFIGCGDAGGAADTQAPVFIRVFPANSGITTSACNGIDLIEGVEVRVLPVDPDGMNTSHYMNVIITGYEISYYRKDTGWAVPKTFTGNLSIYAELNAITSFEIMLCRADMQTMPPLSYLCDFGYEPDTGLDTIHTTCKIIMWGQTVGGKEVVSTPA